jgi:hypothetical protein
MLKNINCKSLVAEVVNICVSATFTESEILQHIHEFTNSLSSVVIEKLVTIFRQQDRRPLIYSRIYLVTTANAGIMT